MLYICWPLYTAPGDYGYLVNAPLSFDIGAAIGNTSCVDIDIFDDEIVEDDEIFSVSLNSSDPVNILVSSANVTIFDNDCKSLILLQLASCTCIYVLLIVLILAQT